MARITLCDASGPLTDLLQKLSGEDGTAWLQTLNKMLRDGAEKVVEKIKSILSHIKQISVEAVGEKKTSKCFINKSRYYHRDPDLDKWLPEFQPNQPLGTFQCWQLTEQATFQEMAESLLGVKGDIQTLSRLLIERGYYTTLPTIEALIERQEAGENVGLRTDGWANFFFVVNKEEGVSVLYASRLDSQWLVRLFPLGYDDLCYAGLRFFSRNKTL